MRGNSAIGRSKYHVRVTGKKTILSLSKDIYKLLEHYYLGTGDNHMHSNGITAFLKRSTCICIKKYPIIMDSHNAQ